MPAAQERQEHGDWFWEVLALIEREVIGKGARGDPDLIACL
jgi:hypothetical protein